MPTYPHLKTLKYQPNPELSVRPLYAGLGITSLLDVGAGYGGVFDLASPLAVSKVMIVCPTCGRASRVGYEFREDEKGRRVKVRVCKRDGCGEVLDR